MLLSGACVGPIKRTAVSWIGFLTLIGVYATVLRGEVDEWRQAAALRDAVLTQAAAVVRSKPCRSPDSPCASLAATAPCDYNVVTWRRRPGSSASATRAVFGCRRR